MLPLRSKAPFYLDATGVKKKFFAQGQSDVVMLKADGTKVPRVFGVLLENGINYLDFIKYRSVPFAPLKIVTS